MAYAAAGGGLTMLTRLRLQNFKCWQDTGDIPLKPITGFFGTNSSGKTSLIQSLLLLKQTVESRDRGLVFDFGDRNSPVDLGDFESVVYRHNANNALGISLDWKARKPLRIANARAKNQAIVESNLLGFRVSARKNAGAAMPVVERMAYRVGDAVFGMSRKDNAEYDIFTEETDFAFTRRRGRAWPLPPPVKCYGFSDQVSANFRYSGFVDDLELEFEQNLRRVYYLGPLRAYPQRIYSWAGSRPKNMGLAGEFAVGAILASRERGETISLGRHRPRLSLEQYVAQWLKDIGLLHDFRVVPITEGGRLYEVRVRKSPNSAEVLLSDTGFGVSQILPALVLCFYAPEGSTVILEQPEIHLHPFAQSALADVFIDAWQKRKVQIIVESHSEYLLNRLQRRIAEENITHEDVSFFFCSEDDEGSRLETLEVDQYGNIKNWPKNFFGDRFGEICAMGDAMINRKKAGR